MSHRPEGRWAAVGKYAALMTIALVVTAAAALGRTARWIRDTLTGTRRADH